MKPKLGPGKLEIVGKAEATGQRAGPQEKKDLGSCPTGPFLAQRREAGGEIECGGESAKKKPLEMGDKVQSAALLVAAFLGQKDCAGLERKIDCCGREEKKLSPLLFPEQMRL